MKDIRKEIESKDYKVPSRLGHWLYYTVMCKLVSKKYNPVYNIIDDINKEEGPCFILFNHLSRLDHIFITEATYPKRFNMICAYNEFFRSHLNMVFKLQQIIPKKQFTNDILTIKSIMRIIKQKGCIAFAPEGIASIYGESHPVIAGTGHLLKHFKIPVYFCELRGQHLTAPWYNPVIKKGETTCTLKKLYTKEDLINKTDEQIDDELNEILYSDEYEHQLNKHIKWDLQNMGAENLEDLLFECPVCHEKFSMDGKGDTIKCNSCGASASVNEFYEIVSNDNNKYPKTITSWVREERANIIKHIRKTLDFSFSTKCRLGYIPNDRLLKNKKTTVICGEGTVSIDHNGFHYEGSMLNENIKMDLSYKELYTLILTTDTTYFGTYYKGEFYEFYPDNTNIVGYILLLVEEMHRLHVNFWKNYKKYDYLYEE